ncbi:BQ2448_1650 [Microbotryum intermedium]|uniref:BQ2448_1650 protein n=1 Tax=Microbotryum intermedium TaxID=269621 RepID=A0A238FGT2_9BASI|nr:BQ2448_1650 [Microbotryum intermedium]
MLMMSHCARACEIKRINSKQLELGEAGSWHDQYKDSAYIYVGGLPFQLTEGDVITIFSQQVHDQVYGEIVDISMPRDPSTQKPRGFAFLMYADQRSTVLAVDNLGGAKVLERTLRVDHVLNYKQLERDEETGKMKEREEQSLAAHPDRHWAPPKPDTEDEGSDSDSSHPSIDPDDPMRDYLIQQARSKGNKSSKSSKSKHNGESKEEREKRREEKRRIKEERARRKEGKRRVEDGPAGRSERETRDDGDRGSRIIEYGHGMGRGRDEYDDGSKRRKEDDRERERERERGGYDDRRGRRGADDDDDAYRRRRDGPSRSSAFADLEKAVGKR